MIKKPLLTGFVLSGGKSRRMGENKALINYNGVSLLENALRNIENSCKSVFISGFNQEYLSFGVPIITDIYLDCGPISGIYSSLLKSETEWNLIVSVDVPYINNDLIDLLTANVGDFDCIIPIHNKGIEPLVAIYNKRIIEKLKSEINLKNFKLHRIISELKTNYIDCTELIAKYPKLFVNLNSQEDISNSIKS